MEPKKHNEAKSNLVLTSANKIHCVGKRLTTSSSLSLGSGRVSTSIRLGQFFHSKWFQRMQLSNITPTEMTLVSRLGNSFPLFQSFSKTIFNSTSETRRIEKKLGGDKAKVSRQNSNARSFERKVAALNDTRKPTAYIQAGATTPVGTNSYSAALFPTRIPPEKATSRITTPNAGWRSQRGDLSGERYSLNLQPELIRVRCSRFKPADSQTSFFDCLTLSSGPLHFKVVNTGLASRISTTERSKEGSLAIGARQLVQQLNDKSGSGISRRTVFTPTPTPSAIPTTKSSPRRVLQPLPHIQVARKPQTLASLLNKVFVTTNSNAICISNSFLNSKSQAENHVPHSIGPLSVVKPRIEHFEDKTQLMPCVRQARDRNMIVSTALRKSKKPPNIARDGLAPSDGNHLYKTALGAESNHYSNPPLEFEYATSSVRTSSRIDFPDAEEQVLHAEATPTAVPVLSKTREPAANWSPADVQQITDQVMRMLDRRIVEHRERMGM